MPAFVAIIFSLVLMTSAIPVSAPTERYETFDKDPQWEGVHNKAEKPRSRQVRQDFGYSPTTAHAGGQPGEMGGHFSNSAEPAYYAKPIEKKTLNDPLSASGRLIYTGMQPHLLLGFFNSDTINEWRTPNSISIRLQGRGNVFYAYVEYATSKWRAGGDSLGGFAAVRDNKSGRMQLQGFKLGESYPWSLRYDPLGNQGAGTITVTIGNETSTCHLSSGHKADGATFNRFGLLVVSKSADGGGEMWFDNVAVNGTTEDFSRDPGWEGFTNRKTFETSNVRPWFDFGYCPTHFAGGKAAGELGGLVFRGDCRFPGKLAAYGDRLSSLGLDKPLKASGRVALKRGVTDSTTLLGFYHSADSLTVNPSQASGIPKSFLGIAIEGPSREGFMLYPMYRVKGDSQGYTKGGDNPHILPDGKSHEWALEYDPEAAQGLGRIVVKMDGQTTQLILKKGDKQSATQFDRFGLITTWIDGNGQQIYFDDLRYTCTQ